MYGDTLKEYRNSKMQQFLSAFISFFFPFLDSMGEDTDKDQQDSKFPTRN
jgi:hypothetical protein